MRHDVDVAMREVHGRYDCNPLSSVEECVGNFRAF